MTTSKNISPAALKDTYNRLYKFYGPQKWWPADTPFEVIIGAILTQNTSWQNVEKAIKNLKSEGALTSPHAFKKISEKRLSHLIRPAGYFNLKARRLKNFINFLAHRYGNSLKRLSRLDTARLRQELLGICGIGPETCDSILLYAFKRPVFVVDAYTKRVFARHRTFGEGADYNEVQKIFMHNLPSGQRLYNEYHALIVRLGKEACKKRPNCKICPIK